MCMTQEKSTQIDASKQEGSIVSDWLHRCCTLDNSAGFFFSLLIKRQQESLRELGEIGQRGEKGKSTGLGLWVLTAAMPLLLPVHHSSLPC